MIERFLHDFGLKIYTTSFWKQDGSYFIGKEEIPIVQKNVILKDGTRPQTPEQIVEAATNGVGKFVGLEGENIRFNVPSANTIAVDITLELFTELTETDPPQR